MSEAYLISQMVKLLEKCHKEKTIVSYRLKELVNQEKLLEAQISSFTTSLGYIISIPILILTRLKRIMMLQNYFVKNHSIRIYRI